MRAPHPTPQIVLPSDHFELDRLERARFVNRPLGLAVIALAASALGVGLVVLGWWLRWEVLG